MKLLDGILGTELSVIKDPFLKDCLDEVSIYYRTWCGRKYWYAVVEFKNGNTKGEQKTPEVDTFEDVIYQLKTILNSIQQKP